MEGSNALEVYRTDGTFIKAIDYPNSGDINQNALSPVIYKNTLYVGSGKNLYAFDISDPETPNVKWAMKFAWRLNDITVDEQGYIYLAIQENANKDATFKIDPNTRNILWSANTFTPSIGYTMDPKAIALNGQQLIVSTGTTVQAFNTQTGTHLWMTKELFCGQAPQAAWHLEPGEDAVFFTAGSCVKAVNSTTGQVIWEFDSDTANQGLGNTFGDKALYHNGVVYAYNGTLWALDAPTGEVLSKQEDKDSTSNFSSVHLYNNQILIWNKYLTAYKPIH
jgi:outer membrane protein assembly factor BamB